MPHDTKIEELQHCPLVQQARAFAYGAHAAVGQTRAYTNEPYADHCGRVVEILAEHNPATTPVMAAAAWLHDTVEDTAVTLDLLNHEFGPDITRLVEQLTDVARPEDGNRARRMTINRDHTAGACRAAQDIKLADLIDNSASIVAHDPAFAQVYLAEKHALLAVLGRGDSALQQRANTVLQQGIAQIEGQGLAIHWDKAG